MALLLGEIRYSGILSFLEVASICLRTKGICASLVKFVTVPQLMVLVQINFSAPICSNMPPHLYGPTLE